MLPNKKGTESIRPFLRSYYFLPALMTAAASAATSAITSSAAAASSAAEATTTTATAAFTRYHRPCLVHRQRATLEVSAIESFDCFRALVIAGHFDKAESLTATRIAIGNYLRGIDRADLLKNRSQTVISCGKRKISHIEFFTHILLSLAHVRLDRKREHEHTARGLKSGC
jgi:hypothetical protein